MSQNPFGILNLESGMKNNADSQQQLLAFGNAVRAYINPDHRLKVDDTVYEMKVLHRNSAESEIRNLITETHQRDAKGNVLYQKGADGKIAPIVTRGKWTNWNDARVRQGYNQKEARDANYFIQPNEITSYRQQIQRYIRWGVPEPEIFVNKDIGRGMTKYTYYKANNIPAPYGSTSFTQKKDTRPDAAESTDNLYGLCYDFGLTMPEKDFNSYGVNPIISLQPKKQDFVIQQLTKSLVVWQQYYKYWGTGVTGLTDVGVTGLLNDSQLSNLYASMGSTGSLTTYGDVWKAANYLVGTLINAKRKGPFVLDLSPGALVQAMQNQSGTTGGVISSEYEKLQTLKQAGMLAAIRMNPFLIKTTTETNSNAAMAIYQLNEDDFEYVESYPLEYYPLPPQGLGIDGKLLFMGKSVLEQSSAVAYGYGLTVNVFSS